MKHCDSAQTHWSRRDNDRWQVWLPPQPGRDYIIGVDPAGGGSEGDYSCAQVVEQRTAMQCAELRGHFPPRELGVRLIEIANLYNDRPSGSRAK